MQLKDINSCHVNNKSCRRLKKKHLINKNALDKGFIPILEFFY